jgi:toxin FitB
VNFLLDTNVISEWAGRRPEPNVVSWLAEADEDRIFVSVIAFAEIRRGIELMAAGKRREPLTQWLAEELPARFADRIVTIDQHATEAWGVVMARAHKMGETLGSIDAFAAAIATAHDLTLVTRNVRDFKSAGIRLLDPWRARP